MSSQSWRARDYDYQLVFAAWRQAFGDALRIRPYAVDLLVERDAPADFWRAADLGPPPVPGGVMVNVRIGARATAMLRELRRLLADHGLEESVHVRHVMREAQRRIEAQFPDDPPFRGLTPDLTARIAKAFRSSNERFVRDYLGGPHARLFEPPLELPPTAVWSFERASSQELRFFEDLVAEAHPALRPTSRP